MRQPRSEILPEHVAEPRLGASRTCNLLTEVFETYSQLKTDYFLRVISSMKKWKNAETELSEFGEYIKLDYLNMAAAFDLTFEVLLGQLCQIGGETWDPLVIPGIPLDSQLAIVEMSPLCAFSAPITLISSASGELKYSPHVLLWALNLLLKARKVERSPFGQMLRGEFRDTKKFQRSKEEEFRDKLFSETQIRLSRSELEILLREIENSNEGEAALYSLLQLSSSYRGLRENIRSTNTKALVRNRSLGILGEDFFLRHDIVLVERKYP